MLFTLLPGCSAFASAQPEVKNKKDEKPLPIAALKPRLVGPAVTSGRVVGFAVHPNDRSHYFVAVASGGVWKTTNARHDLDAGLRQRGSYSIGCIAMDPKNPNVVWVGTGENNSQRSVAYGDGVYKSNDGGKTWQNVGLKDDRAHRQDRDRPARLRHGLRRGAGAALEGRAAIAGSTRPPTAARPGTRCSTSTRTPASPMSCSTRATPMCSSRPVISAAGTSGRSSTAGPGSAIHRSTDGGKTWKKITAGLPAGDLGRIGLAIAPTDPDIVYAIVEAAEGAGGIYRSTDGGADLGEAQPLRGAGAVLLAPRRRSGQQGPHLRDERPHPGLRRRRQDARAARRTRTSTSTTTRSGSTRRTRSITSSAATAASTRATIAARTGTSSRTCRSRSSTTSPATRAARSTTSTAARRTTSRSAARPARAATHGIMNQDWFVVQGGDGFHCKVDPTDPNTVYGALQYGVLCRFDRRTGQRVQIQPQPGAGEPPLRWNWD